MNWVEPWSAVWGERPPFKLGTKRQLQDSWAWTLALIPAIAISAILAENPWPVLSRAWIALPFGILLAHVVYAVYWFFPGTVGTGPAGILRESDGKSLLVPWKAIAGFEVKTEKRAKVLIVETRDGTKHRFLVPAKFRSDEIVSLLRENGVEA